MGRGRARQGSGEAALATNVIDETEREYPCTGDLTVTSANGERLSPDLVDPPERDLEIKSAPKPTRAGGLGNRIAAIRP